MVNLSRSFLLSKYPDSLIQESVINLYVIECMVWKVDIINGVETKNVCTFFYF